MQSPCYVVGNKNRQIDAAYECDYISKILELKNDQPGFLKIFSRK